MNDIQMLQMLQLQKQMLDSQIATLQKRQSVLATNTAVANTARDIQAVRQAAAQAAYDAVMKYL